MTVSHYDLPQTLQDEFGGWRSRHIVPLFTFFAETCFAAFGDRVKYWITINEIHNYAIKYTNIGCRNPSGLCAPGNSSTWVYTAGHHMLLSHAFAVEVYRTKFQTKQGGKIGIVADAQWYEPYSDNPWDIAAVDRMQAFQVRWVLDPIYYGRYPEMLVDRLGDRLPRFSEGEAQLLRGSVDFLGINHYTTHYAVDQTNSTEQLDSGAASVGSRGGVPIGPKAGSIWLNIVPFGIQKVLNYIRIQYNNPIVYITENGVDEDNDPGIPLDVALKDSFRTKYHVDYLSYVNAAIRDGCDVRGYFIWSLLDNFEWDDGLSKRFGLYYVDYDHNQTRYAKDSAKWFKEFLRPSLRPNHAKS